jgi:hypothetical protein
VKLINERVLVRVIRDLRAAAEKVRNAGRPYPDEVMTWAAHEVEQVLVSEAGHE